VLLLVGLFLAGTGRLRNLDASSAP
jgi:hypothetical protein